MKEELTEQKAIRYAKNTLIVSVLLMLLALFLLFYFFKYCPDCGKSNYTIAESGQFGDSFNGVLAPIIGVCVSILTFLAFYIQYEANKIQRKGQAIQQFDSTFFNLVSTHSQIVNTIKETWNFDREYVIHDEYRLINKTIEGREIFKKVACAIKEVFDGDAEKLKTTKYALDNTDGHRETLNKNNPLEVIKLDLSPMPHDGTKLDEAFLTFYRIYRSAFSHYFRNLYHIIKFIVEYEGFKDLYNEAEENKIKGRYIKIIRAQLSSYELILLWYNGRQHFGESFGKLMLDYELLDNIDFGAEIVLPDLLKEEHPYLA